MSLVTKERKKKETEPVIFWRYGASIISKAWVFIKLMGNHNLLGDPFLDLYILLLFTWKSFETYKKVVRIRRVQ